MAITTATFQWYDHVSERAGDGGIDWDTNAFQITLHTSLYTFASTHTTNTDLTNEVTGNGYAAINLANVTWIRSGSTTTFNADDPVWTASGGSIVARRYVVRDTTANLLICSGLLDSTNADVTTTDTNTLTFQINASGLFTATLTGA
jgi:hypothetical protein